MRKIIFIMALLSLVACGNDTNPSATGVTAQNDASGDGAGNLDAADGSAGSDATSDSTGLNDSSTADVAAVDDAVSDTGASADDLGTPADVTIKYQQCSDLLMCTTIACAGGIPLGCEKVCTQVASPAAKTQLQPVLDCLDTWCRKGACAGNSLPNCMDQCAFAKCGLAQIKCNADGKSGAADCGSALTCLNKCNNASSLTCSTDCYAAVSAQGQTDLDALFSCMIANGGTNPADSCPMQALKCTSGAKTGTKTCWDTLNCAMMCKDPATKDQCGLDCYGQATADAQTQYVKTFKCLQDTSGNGQCVGEIVACIAPDGTKACLDMITCSQACANSPDKDLCNFQCIKSGSLAEATKLGALLQCQGTNCPGLSGQEQLTCTKTKCTAQLNSCLGQ